MASLIIKLCSFSSNSIIVIELFLHLISYHFSFISYHYSVIFYHYSFISFSFLFYLIFISFLSFIWTCLLGGFLCTIIFISLYGDAPLVLQVTASTQAPIISPFNPPPLEWSVRRTLECEQTLKFCLIKVYCYLAGKFDSIFS